VIATFLETVREPERYVAALDRAAAVGKPVVVLKVGRTERTQHAITSHTGGLAGQARVFSEVLRAHRAIEVSDLDEMTEVLAVCQGERWPRGRRISVITGSGGLAEMILDNATAAGIDLPPLSPQERTDAEAVIGRITGDGNPFDAWGNGNYAVNLPHAMSVVDRSGRIDAIVYCADTGNEGHFGDPRRVIETVNMLAQASQASNKPYYLMNSRPGLMNTQQVSALRQHGLVQIGGTRQGLGALDRVGRYMMEQPPLRTPAVLQRSALAATACRTTGSTRSISIAPFGSSTRSSLTSRYGGARAINRSSSSATVRST
jgi:acetate---CoA ligase (ADP-forming)